MIIVSSHNIFGPRKKIRRAKTKSHSFDLNIRPWTFLRLLFHHIFFTTDFFWIDPISSLLFPPITSSPPIAIVIAWAGVQVKGKRLLLGEAEGENRIGESGFHKVLSCR